MSVFRSRWRQTRANHSQLGRLIVEHLDDRSLPSVSFAFDPGTGRNSVTFDYSASNSADALVLRQGASGWLEYSLNAMAFTSDLNSAASGSQPLPLSAIGKISVLLGGGNDTLALNTESGSVLPSPYGIAYSGDSGVDQITVAHDTNFTLTDANLTLSGLGVIDIASVERANITGGNGPNVIDAAQFTLGPVILDGGNQNDTLTGGAGNDTISGTQGNDIIDGRAGNDVLKSGNSGSVLYGGTGDDTLYGGNGQDFLYGQDGDDQCFGNNGVDSLHGGDGNDLLDGGSSNDTIAGGAGYDTVQAIGDVSYVLTNSTLSGLGTDSLNSIENARLLGGANNRTIDCSEFTGDATLDGGGGTDTLIGSSGSNNFVNNQGGNTTIVGGGSSNTINLTPSGFVALVDSGGLDTLNFSTSNTGITIDLTQTTGTGQDVDSSGFTVALNGTFENVSGTSFTDTIIGNGASNLIYGGLGADQIDGGIGNDIIYGGTASGGSDLDLSNDIIYGGMGTDQIDGGAGNDIIYGGTASSAGDVDLSNDIIYGGVGSDQIDGGAGNDIIYGGTRGGEEDGDVVAGSNNDIIYGGVGSDQVDGGDGNDIIYGGTRGGEEDGDIVAGSNNDIIYGGTGSDQVDGGAGNDIIYGGTRGGEEDGDVVAGNNNDIIYGGVGNDQVDGGDGNDIIYGGTRGGEEDGDVVAGSNNDIIYGGTGSDQVDGGDGNDIIYGGTRGGEEDGDVVAGNNNDIIYGGVGSDQVDGGEGNDIIYGGTRGGEEDGDVVVGSNNDIIYGGVGSDQVDGGDGNDIIYGGTGTRDSDISGESDILFGGAGNDALVGGSGDDSLSGGAGDDAYVFGSGNLGSDVIVEAADASTDTLDFSAFGGAVHVDLALIAPQVVNAGNLSLTFSSDTAIENVVGSRYADTILGNGRDNHLLGADQFDDRFGDAAIWNGVTQVVVLNFDSHHSVLVAEDHPYTQAERDAIQTRLEADYGRFHVQFTQTLPAGGAYATLFFNKTPIVNGQPQPGGLADGLDFRNVNLGGTAAIDVNLFLGGPNQPAATSEHYVAFSATVSGHELGHLLGLRHLDSAGPIGFGLPAAVPSTSLLPPYPGPAQAFETNWHVMASPASVGSSLDDAVGDPFFGEREAIKLAFNESGTVVNEQATPHDSRSTAQPLTLASLAVPNTLQNGLNYGRDFAVAATAALGSINLTGTGVSEDDFYSFSGRTGDVINIQVMSNALTRVDNPIDSILRVFDSTGSLVTYYSSTGENDDELEGQDSILLDLILPADGTFYIQVDTFTNVDVADTDTGDYELFVYRFDVGNASDDGDYLDGRGGSDNLVGGLGNDTLVGGTGVNTLNGGAGIDKVIESGDVNFVLSDSGLVGPGSASLVGIEQAQLTGGDGANSFQINGWTGTAAIDGGDGTDSLTGANETNSWNLSTTGAGNVNWAVTFIGIENLRGGTAIDILNCGDFGSAVSVNLAGDSLTGFSSFSGMEGLVGSAASDTVVAANTVNSWDLTAAGAGSVGGFAFSAVENLVGGLTIDALNYSAFAGPVAVDLATGAATGFNSFAGMEGLAGSTSLDILIGLNATNSWNISAQNSGTVGGFAFSNIENLSGGSADDTYILANNSGVAGVINGNGGVNSLDYVAYLLGVSANLTTGIATGTGGITNLRHVFGGSGNDTITGDTNANIFVGNGGNDTLFGNGGRDILIGGAGSDLLDGGSDDDILLGGVTSYDSNRTALLALLLEWTRLDLGYGGRVDHLNGAVAGGLNGTFRFNATTVFNDNSAADSLWGRGGTDWFITSRQDNVMDKVSGESITRL